MEPMAIKTMTIHAQVMPTAAGTIAGSQGGAKVFGWENGWDSYDLQQEKYMQITKVH